MSKKFLSGIETDIVTGLVDPAGDTDATNKKWTLAETNSKVEDKGEWIQTHYDYNDQASQDGYLARVINPAGTDDPLAPQNVGEQVLLYNILTDATTGDPYPRPVYVPVNGGVQTVRTGVAAKFAEAFQSLEILIKVPSSTVNDHHRIVSISDPWGPAPVTETIDNANLIANEWVVVKYSNVIHPADKTFLIYIETNTTANHVEHTGQYTYLKTGNQDPASGQIIRNNNGDTIKIAVTDFNGQDLLAQLGSCDGGDGIEYTQTNSSGQHELIEFTDIGVLGGTAPNEYYTFPCFIKNSTAQPDSSALTSTTLFVYDDGESYYNEDVNHLAGSLAYQTGQIKGYIQNGNDAYTLNDNTYGVEIKAQRLSVSPDWQIRATSSSTSSSSSTGGTGGTGLHIGDTPPTVPADFPIWFDSSNGFTYKYYNDGNSNQWVQEPDARTGATGADSTVQGPQGIQGPAGTTGTDGADGADGADGTTGPTGPVGADGSTILNGIVPATGGADGDFYIDTNLNTIAGPRSTTWPQPVDMVGEDGIQGIDGADGATGPTGPAGAEGPTAVSVDTPNAATISLNDGLLFVEDPASQLRMAIGNINNPMLHMPLIQNMAMKHGDGETTFTRAGTATYTDRYGIVQTAAVDEPRFEKEGLLIEGASTNFAINSEDLTASGWTLAQASITADSILSPDGITYADKIVENTSLSASHNIRINLVGMLEIGKTYAASFFIKGGERTNAKIVYGTYDAKGIRIDLTDGSYTTWASPEGHSVTKLQDDWYRVSVVYTPASEFKADYFYCYLLDDALSDAYDGDGVSGLYVWGGQVEELPFATSYIPTTTAAVTRLAEYFSIDAKDNCTNESSSNSLSLDASLLGDTGNFGHLVNFDGVPERTMELSSDNVIIDYDGKNTVVNAVGLYGTSIRIGFSYQEDGEVMTFLDGDIITTTTPIDTVSTVPTGIRIFSSNATMVNPVYGHIKNFRIWDFALTEDEVALA